MEVWLGLVDLMSVVVFAEQWPLGRPVVLEGQVLSEAEFGLEQRREVGAVRPAVF